MKYQSIRRAKFLLKQICAAGTKDNITIRRSTEIDLGIKHPYQE
jgi:hypothetical protein